MIYYRSSLHQSHQINKRLVRVDNILKKKIQIKIHKLSKKVKHNV